MLKRILSTLPLLVLLIACQATSKKDLVQKRTQAFYAALKDSNFENMAELHYDSVRVKEGDYSSVYSVQDYVNWLKWDSVFKPTYEILEFNNYGDSADVTVSKNDIRLNFLNQAPVITKERILFKKGKIYSMEIIESSSLTNPNWNKNREKLVNWVSENHPELNGFIHDQTLTGGLKYLRALQLYQAQTSSKMP